MKIIKKCIEVLLLCYLVFSLAVVISGCGENIENRTSEEPAKQEIAPELTCTSTLEFVQGSVQECVLHFVTQPAENIEKVIIISDCINSRTIYITEQFQIEYIHTLIEKTIITLVEKHPGHSNHPMWGSHFTLKLVYQDGDIDEFRTAENPELILRLLDTRGGSGDRGFVLGINERLWKYIYNLLEDIEDRISDTEVPPLDAEMEQSPPEDIKSTLSKRYSSVWWPEQ